MIGKSRPDGSRLFVSFHFCLLLFFVVASQELRHPISSLWSLSLKLFPFSSPLGLIRVCFLPLYPFFFILLTFVFIFLYLYFALLNHLLALWALSGCRLSPPVQQVINQASIFLHTRRRAPQQAAVTRARASSPQWCVLSPQHKRFRRAINVFRFPCALAFNALPFHPCHT